jgi:signal transduction histidine kinase
MHRPTTAHARQPAGRLPPRSAGARVEHGDGPPAELRAVIGAMPEAVVVCDAADRVRLTNSAADRLFVGRPPKDRDDVLSRFEALPAPGQGPVTLRLKHRPSRWYELRTVPIERGDWRDEPAGADGGGRILVLRDVTAAREERAERSAFLSILSHELRTPITTIYAGSRVLARHGGTSPRASQEIAADISAEAARLYDVVEDLLVLTRAEQGILELSDEPVHLQRVIEGAIRIAAGRMPSAPVVYAGADDPPAVRGDGVYVEQVVRNLLTAATRFAGPGTPVTIRLEPQDGEVVLSILDRGPELTENDLESSFTLADDRSDLRRSRLGIGLFVCRRLIEAMHGRVWVKRREGGGAEFGFALPRYAVD